MNVKELFLIQKQLNDRIVDEHNLIGRDLFYDQLLAFIVEISELANETRSFKYWSRKTSSERSVILEEYVDGLHFVLTLGLTLNVTSITILDEYKTENETTEQFLQVLKDASALGETKTETQYMQLVTSFFMLGQILGFSNKEIEEAYLQKNKVNHERQDAGY
ncbi:dimeric dUTPase [Halalkalibacter wakoensis JCM 9140]|uniref:Dimeric dUTPase n=1 Tax=Halalkalibacter wakoensis JCM 9140 TaxID=1236970 RepID=W4Q8K6_9BACI|nr:dUTP diphosphatase [Halalkalibacter wakoensis]GAE28312.1 dimeric dUTPase [Halalkalibacter wakoensis JCM 9140]